MYQKCYLGRSKAESEQFYIKLIGQFSLRITHLLFFSSFSTGDVYMVASGLPDRNGNRHTIDIAELSLDLIKTMEGFRVPQLKGEPLLLRIGFSTGIESDRGTPSSLGVSIFPQTRHLRTDHLILMVGSRCAWGGGWGGGGEDVFGWNVFL